MESTKLSQILETKKGLPFCHIHKLEQQSWICLEPVCQKRLFCSFCIIQEHSRIHKNFANLFSFLIDPVIALKGLDSVEPGSVQNLDHSKSIRTRLEVALNREEGKLDKICDELKATLKENFGELQKGFRTDLELFLDMNRERFSVLENMKEEYMGISRDIFSSLDLDDPNSVKKGVSELFKRFNSDKEIYDQIQKVFSCLPEIKRNEEYPINLKGRRLKDLNWQIFFEKNNSNNK